MAVERKAWPDPTDLCEAQLEVPAALLEALHEREAVCGSDAFAQDMSTRRAEVVPPERLICRGSPPSIDAFAALLRRLEEVSGLFIDPDRKEYARNDFRGDPLTFVELWPDSGEEEGAFAARLWAEFMPPRGAPGRGTALDTYNHWLHAIKRSISKLRYVHRGTRAGGTYRTGSYDVTVYNGTGWQANVRLMPFYNSTLTVPLPDNFDTGGYTAYELGDPVGTVAARGSCTVTIPESDFKFAVIYDFGPYFAYGRTSP